MADAARRQPAGKVPGLAVLLILANPVNLSMIIAAAVELGQHRLSLTANLVVAALFTLLGSLTVFAPYVAAVFLGKDSGLLPRLRRLLLTYNNAGGGGDIRIRDDEQIAHVDPRRIIRWAQHKSH